LGERRSDLLHAVDQIDRSSGWQHQAAGRIAAAGNRRIRFDFVEPRDGELDAQRLAVKDEAADGIGESLGKLGAIDVANGRRNALARSSGIRRGSRYNFLGSHSSSPRRRFPPRFFSRLRQSAN
jgi:hypothetical protein